MTTQRIREMSRQEFDEECAKLRANLKQFRNSLKEVIPSEITSTQV